MDQSKPKLVLPLLQGYCLFMEKQKFLLLRIQKLCDSINISIPLGKKKKGTFLLETFSSVIQTRVDMVLALACRV